MDFNIILACDEKEGIGKQIGDKQIIPWKIDEDMIFFKLITSDTNVYNSKEEENNSYIKIIDHIFGPMISDDDHAQRMANIMQESEESDSLEESEESEESDEVEEQTKSVVLEEEIPADKNDTPEQIINKLKLNMQIRLRNYKIQADKSRKECEKKYEKIEKKIIKKCREREEERNNTIPFASNNNLINAIIMGRKTADTLSKPLADRLNIVITSKENYRKDEGFESFLSLDNALNELNTNKQITNKQITNKQISKVFVIGGAELCDQAIFHPRCRGLFLTRILVDYKTNIKLSDKFLSRISNTSIFQPTWGEKTQSVNSEWADLSRTDRKNLENLNTSEGMFAGWDIEFVKLSYVNNQETKYLNLLEKIITTGDFRKTRNASTYSVFGEKLEFDLSEGFPLLTTKQVFFRGIAEELLFFLRGDTNTKSLEDKKVMIWHDNTTKEFMQKNSKDLAVAITEVLVWFR